MARLSPLIVPRDDKADAIFDLALLHFRAKAPAFAHHPLHELAIIFGDLRNEIAEVLDPVPQCPCRICSSGS